MNLRERLQGIYASGFTHGDIGFKDDDSMIEKTTAAIAADLKEALYIPDCHKGQASDYCPNCVTRKRIDRYCGVEGAE